MFVIQARSRPAPAVLSAAFIGVAGCASSVVAVVAGGHAYTASSTPSTSWLQLLAPEGFDAGDSLIFGFLLFAGLTGLVGCWLLAIGAEARGRLSRRNVWVIGVAWSLPLAVGPPLISKDIYAYAANAVMQRHGLDVYRASPAALARVHTSSAAESLAAVDPRWRHAFSPYGPLATAVERVAGTLGGGSPISVLIALRVLAAVSVVVVARAAATLAGVQATRALVLVGLNPLLLLHGLSGAHFEAVMCALLLAALVAADHERWTYAIVLACAAGLVKAPALLAVPAVIVWHATHASPALPNRRWRRPRTAATRTGLTHSVLRDSVVAAAALATMSLAVPDGWGWVQSLAAPAAGDTSSSLSGAAGTALHVVTRTPLVSTVATVTAGFIAVAVVLRLCATMSHRRLAASVGYGLLAVALLAPITYPWYLLWGATCALAVEPAGRRRDFLIALCSVAALVSTPGLPGAVAGSLSLASLAVAAGVLRHRWRSSVGNALFRSGRRRIS